MTNILITRCLEEDSPPNLYYITNVSEDDYYSLTIPFEILPDVDYYLLSVNYTTGDSFGVYPEQRAFIDLYKSYEDAEAMKNQIQTHYDFYSYNPANPDSCSNTGLQGKRRRQIVKQLLGEENSIRLKNGMGVFYNMFVMWYGYFEALDGIEIIKLRLKS